MNNNTNQTHTCACNGCGFSDEISQIEHNLSQQIDDTPTPEGNEYIEVEMRTWKTLYFINSNGVKLNPDDYVICEVDRGQDIGKVTHTAIRGKTLDEQYAQGKITPVIRCATSNDLSSLTELQEREKLASDKYNETLAKYSFDMKLLDTIFQFDGNKVTFFFTAEGRVDFRDFVKELAAIFKTRIELHQCTGRDEAKKIGGYGMCGNAFCCSTFLKRFNQVTIKMAKDQNLSSNLSKISGPCGRLLCCLHFEEDFYSDLSKDYPEIGDEVWYNGKKMYVFRNDIDAKTILLTTEAQEMTTISLADYQAILAKKGKRHHEPPKNT